jgi:two-component system cell cycle sensor histidine kinase/response regulator CckA
MSEQPSRMSASSGSDLFQVAFNGAADAIMISDFGGKFIAVNDRFCELIGYSREEVMKKTGDELMDAEAGLDLSAFRKKISEQGFVIFESAYRNRSGVLIPIEVHSRIIEYGGKKAILGIARDITERKRAERAVVERENLYRALIETTGTGFVIIDMKGTVVNANSEYVRLTGHTSLGEIQGQSVMQWTASYDRDKNIKAIEYCVDNGFFRHFEIDYITPAGVVIPVELNATVVEIDGEKKILTLCRDISHRRSIERKIHDREELFRKVFEDGSHGMILADKEHRIVAPNDAFCRMIGYDKTELIGRRFSEFIHPDEVHDVTSFVELRDQGKFRINKIETRYVKKNRETLWTSVTVTEIRDKDGNFLNNLAMVVDITERKKTEETLRNAQKLESIGVLAGGIAHDFNNLLGGIFGNLDLAPAEGIAALKRALGVSDRARSLTAQLLTFAKGGSPQRRPVALQPLILDATRFALSGSNVETVFSIASDLWPCNIDESQIGQVIDNIVINAAQAMPAGGTLSVQAINIEIQAGDHALLHPGHYVKVGFSDTGVGIPATHLRRIFDPFFSTKQKGSGLGLAIAYSIIKRHDGVIEVESHPGKGSAFYLYLPAVQDAVDEQRKSDTREFRGQGTILVMDDERFILHVASRMLAIMGFTTITAVSGDEAVKKTREAMQSGTAVRAAILDLTIPGGKGGKEYVRELCSLDPSIKAIVSSGYNDDPVMAEPEKYGFAGRLKKPYEIKELKHVLREVLGTV